MIRIAAVVAARNEELHIERCLASFVSQGIDVVLIDNDSEDRTVELAKPFLGKGLCSIERLPWKGLFALREQLELKASIIERLPHDWVIHADTDEWLCAPSQEVSLSTAVDRVDQAGFDVVNFEEMTFVALPHENFAGTDYVREMRTYYFFEPAKLRLMRAWKRIAQNFNVSSGGHRLHGGSIYPEHFILRHYMALSPDLLFRKYDRRPFDPSECAIGWHHNSEHQRIGITREQSFVKPSPHLKSLPYWSSVEFNRSCPARKHYWQW